MCGQREKGGFYTCRKRLKDNFRRNAAGLLLARRPAACMQGDQLVPLQLVSLQGDQLVSLQGARRPAGILARRPAAIRPTWTESQPNRSDSAQNESLRFGPIGRIVRDQVILFRVHSSAAGRDQQGSWPFISRAFIRARSAGELAIAAMKEDEVHRDSIDAKAAESLDYPAPASPLKAHNVHKVQRRRPKMSSSGISITTASLISTCRPLVSPATSVASASPTALRQYSPETLAAAQNLMRDRVRSYRSLVQAEADFARHFRSGHGQRQQIQQAQADTDEHFAKERIQQWLTDSVRLHQQAAPTAPLNKTSGL